MINLHHSAKYEKITHQNDKIYNKICFIPTLQKKFYNLAAIVKFVFAVTKKVATFLPSFNDN